jgi:hypothetical protein
MLSEALDCELRQAWTIGPCAMRASVARRRRALAHHSLLPEPRPAGARTSISTFASAETMAGSQKLPAEPSRDCALGQLLWRSLDVT